MADPARRPGAARADGRRSPLSPGQSSPTGTATGSPLWRRRSRRRRLEVLSLPFRPAQTAATALGGSLNDFFVTGAVAGAARYHQAHAVPVEALTITFIVSTQHRPIGGGNAFTPSKATVPAGPWPLLLVSRPSVTCWPAAGARSRATAARQAGRHGEPAADLASPPAWPARGPPASTSPRPTSGCTLRGLRRRRPRACQLPVGPVAGTAWNVTLMSYAGQLDLGSTSTPSRYPTQTSC